MRAEALKSHIRQTSPTTDVTLILDWKIRPNLNELSAIPNHAERRQRLRAFYDAAKQPVLDDIAAEPGVRVTNVLDGTGQAVVAAPAQTWMKLLDRQDCPLACSDIDITMNERVYALGA